MPGMLPWKDRGIPGYLAVLFVRATVHDPAGCPVGPLLRRSGPAGAAAWPVLAVATLLPSGSGKSLGARVPRRHSSRMCILRGCATRGSGRSRTYASTAMLPSPQQGSLPACRAQALAGRGSHPQDGTRISRSHRILPSLRCRPCLVASPRKKAPEEGAPRKTCHHSVMVYVAWGSRGSVIGRGPLWPAGDAERVAHSPSSSCWL